MGIITQILDSTINYQGIFAFVLLYLGVMWLMFCLWVFIDAKNRYHKIWIAILVTLFVLPLNIPGFILYLIARPDDSDWKEELEAYGAVNVPVVHFVNSEGEMQMSLNLTVSPRLNPRSDMSVDISWDSEQSHFRAHEPAAVNSNAIATESNTEARSQLQSRLSDFRAKASESLKGLKDSVNKSVEQPPIEEVLQQESNNEPQDMEQFSDESDSEKKPKHKKK